MEQKLNSRAEQFMNIAFQPDQKTLPALGHLVSFCQDCWAFGDFQTVCFEKLNKDFQALSVREKMEIIPELVKNSMVYPRLVFLAKELFDSLSPAEQKRLSIPMVYWTTDDKETHICQAEYLWRVQNGLPCRQTEDSYRRPFKAADLQCFEKLLHLWHDSGSRAVIHWIGLETD